MNSAYFAGHTGDGEVQVRARVIIRELKEQLNSVPPDKIRQVLRNLQLTWHPDKNTASLEEEQVAVAVFKYVQHCWDEAFKKSTFPS